MDSVTWESAVVTAAISAIVGAVVSLLAVSQVTVRQRRAERRDQARVELHEAVQPLRADVRKYQARIKSGMKRDQNAVIQGEDYAYATQWLTIAARLHPVRQWLVRRRTRRLVGKLIWQVADISPMRDEGLGSIAPLLFAQVTPEQFGLQEGDSPFGLLHEALTTDPGSPQLRRLERSLARLAAGR